MGKKILVIGSLNIDMVTQMENMPMEGETVLGNELQYIPGGKGANQAGAAGNLGADVTMLGCIGNDEFGRIQLEELKSRGVRTQNIKTSQSSKTGTAIIYLNAKGNNSIVVIQGANLECDASYIKEQDNCLKECDYLLLQMEIPYEAIYYAIKRASELGKIIMLNPAPAPDEIPEDILRMIDYITPNETELQKLSGIRGADMESVRIAAEKLIEKGVKNVIVTLGERGAVLVQKDRFAAFEAEKAEVVDTTAAGDCFTGAFLVALAEGRSAEEAICFANAASSIAVTRMGALNSIPKREEIKDWNVR